MNRILLFPINVPSMVWKRSSLSNAALLKHLSCLKTTTPVPFFPASCNFFHECTVFANPTIATFWVRVHCLLLAKTALLGKNNKDKNNLWLQVRYCIARRIRVLWTTRSLSQFLWFRSSLFYTRVWLLKLKFDQIFRASCLFFLCLNL